MLPGIFFRIWEISKFIISPAANHVMQSNEVIRQKALEILNVSDLSIKQESQRFAVFVLNTETLYNPQRIVLL